MVYSQSPQSSSGVESTVRPRQATRRRQDPVSCRLCRVKKLKCSRQQPCSNCIARNVSCEFEQNYSTNTARIRQDAEPSNADIIARLQRLEEMMVQMSQTIPPTPESILGRRPDVDQPVASLSPVEESHQIESQALSSIGTQQPSLYPDISTSWVFEVTPLAQIVDQKASRPISIEQSKRNRRRIFFPTYADAFEMFEQYAKKICYYHHIVHLSTLHRLMDDFYTRQSRQEPIDTDCAALLLTIFATVLCYTRWQDPEDANFDPSFDRDGTFLSFFRGALDLLDHSRRVLPGSLEILQAAVIIVFLDYNVEGFTSRARAILAQGITTAKDLAFHRLDSPASVRRREGNTSKEQMIELEMKRRIWWHLVATDWMVSLAGSSQEGTYVAHPHQMRVRLPRNIDDDVLDRGDFTEDLPLSQPTAMAYPMQRIRLGEIARTVVDTLRIGISDPSEQDLTQVLNLDRRLDHFLDDLPIFLKIDDESIKKSLHILDRYPYLAMHRYIINIGAQSIRCKLHQPYLVSGRKDQRHKQSAEKCLNAAMAVIELNKAIQTSTSQSIPWKVRLTGLLHHMFLATVVLVMDLCFNHGTTIDSEVKNTDVANALKMLEAAKTESASVQKFLDSLSEALRKHHVRLRDDGSTDDPATTGQGWQLQRQTSEQQDEVVEMMNTIPNPVLEFDSEICAPFYGGEAANMPDWESLFAELDTFIA